MRWVLRFRRGIYKTRTNKKEFIGIYWELHGCSTGLPPEFASLLTIQKNLSWRFPTLWLNGLQLVGAAFSSACNKRSLLLSLMVETFSTSGHLLMACVPVHLSESVSSWGLDAFDSLSELILFFAVQVMFYIFSSLFSVYKEDQVDGTTQSTQYRARAV